jgi:hypothetical protein
MGDSEIENRGMLDAKLFFSSAGAAMQGMRLRIEYEVVVSVEDLLAPLQEARRFFEERKFRQAYAKCDHVYREFRERVRQWEKAAEARLEAIKKAHKPGKLERLKIEIADVKRQSHGAFRLVSALRGALELASRFEDAAEVKPAATRAAERTGTVRRALVVDESLLEFPDDLPPNY